MTHEATDRRVSGERGWDRCDVVVAGLGVMGSAVAAVLARRGARVVGLDRHRPPHVRGSSHGETRMIRQAYFEDPRYVPMVRRAWNGWRSLEDRRGVRLLERTGGLMLGPRDGVLLSGVRTSAEAHGLSVEELTAAEVERRFPSVRLPGGGGGVLEDRAGYLHAERSVKALLADARAAGARLCPGEPMVGWEGGDGAVTVITPEGRIRAARLVLAAGPWLPGLLPRVDLPLAVERQVQLWFEPAETPAEFSPGRLPVFVREEASGDLWYGFPHVGGGVKVARHHGGLPSSPDDVDREVRKEDVDEVRGLLRSGLPGADGALLRGSVCLYTNTPDGHFILDHHPEVPRVTIVSACSGHGFKFAPVVGEIAADLALDGGSELRPDLFALDRLA